MVNSKISYKKEDEPLFIQFCSKRELRFESVKSYRYALRKYTKFTNKKLEELIEEAESEEDEHPHIRLRKRKINTYLTNFKSELDESNLTEKTKRYILLLVKAFYREFEIEVPKSKRGKSINSTKIETIEDLPTIKEIERFMEYCNSVYKAIIVTGLSSGMSRAELSSLTFKHFFDAIPLESYPETLSDTLDVLKEKKDLVLSWNIERVKTGNKYFTFSSPESLDRITTYLEELHHKHPEFNPKLEDKLFRSLSVNNPINTNTMGSMFNYTNKNHDFRRVNGCYVVRNHNLRKYFATTLERNKVPHLSTRWMLGHTIDKVTNAYFKADPKAVKEDYLKVVNELTTNKVEIKVINKYETIEHQVNTIKKELNDVKEGLIIESGYMPQVVVDYIHLLESKQTPIF